MGKKRTAPNETTPVISAVPLAVPVSEASYGTLSTYYTVPEERKPDCFWFAVTSPFQWLTWKMAMFHTANLLLSVVAFGVISFCLSLGLALLPLCCIGVVVFKFLMYLVYFIAQADALLYNVIAPTHQHISVGFSCPRGGFAYEGIRVTPALTTFSRDGLVAIMYYLLVKFPLAILFSGSLLMLFSVAISFISFPWTFPAQWDFDGADFQLLGRPITEDDAPYMLVVGVLFLYLAIFVLHMCARIVQSITRFCTCEYFSVFGYAHSNRGFSSGQPIQGQHTLYVQI
ncbi:hypothetical protein H310_00444 [Aphanomyces invadans]|uniref:Sensor domain-containing protein n=1 Tax=Aphanomyces invadans TaxID=157072 RepID=A0A024UU56_9STRA|nr:hypothetical protein H310_00444 [Aphanomyces invadans]ETW10056.1 hypothetical protein H310_00444 [Aphanomyces invadans]|eukprot:XP_008861467.1 hypothetical protein H310_00444 [Aphanomyces invadans]